MYSSGWFGSLTNLNNTTMYIYRADVSDTLRMIGTMIDPATTNIPVTTGWNWIGYIPNYSLPINDALGSIPAQVGDVIKSQLAFAQYLDPVSGWVGNLKYLSPPNGYQIKLSQPGTLTYPPAPNPFGETKVLARGESDPPLTTFWTINPAQYEFSSTLIGMLRVNGQNGTEADMELGAFVNGELRGAAPAIFIEPLNAYLFFLTTYANTSDELLHYQLYDASAETVSDLAETMFFSPNQHQGSIDTPVPFELLTTGTEAESVPGLAFEVQPNPFSSETRMRFAVPAAQTVALTITDPQGREVLRRQIQARTGLNSVTWDGRSETGAWLNSGVYVVRLQTEAGSISKKVVLQRLP